MRGRWIVLLAVMGAGCATYSGNVSYLYGERYHRARINTYATRITAIDGQAPLLQLNPVPVEPGQRLIRLSTAPVAGFTLPEYREMPLNVEPCKRYFIVAERDNRLLQDWRPVIDHLEPSGGAGCP